MIRYGILLVAFCCYSAEAFFGCGCVPCTPCVPALPPPLPMPCPIALPPPMPPPPPPCPPLPPPCPPPPICPPPMCPPPIICPPPPPPPPPPPMPICLPPPPPPPPMMCPQPLPPPPPPPVMMPLPQNDCCCQCMTPCHYTARRRMHGARIFSDIIREVKEDPTCNNERLKAIMEENATKDPSISKRAIQAAAEEKLKEKFNVICASGDFSYVAYTDNYCQIATEHVTCYAFKPMVSA